MIWWIILCFIVLVIVALFSASYYLLCLAVKRKDAKKYVGANVLGPSPRQSYLSEIQQAFDWAAAQPHIWLSINSKDGLKLYARLVEHTNAKGCILLFHGFRSSPERDFNIMIPYLYSLGYSLLLIDVRSHGRSEGKFMTYGVKESDDCELWAKQISSLYPKLPLYLYGTSMGASTVMFASDHDLPSEVKGIIADCGFTCPWDILARSLKRKTGLLPFPILYFAEIWIHLLCHYDLHLSTVGSLKKTDIPVLFVHGTDDVTILSEMTVKNYDACASAKRLVLVAGGEHCTNFLIGDKEYFNAINDLLNLEI